MNCITIVGNLGADPDYKLTANGTPLAILNVAVTRPDAAKTTDWFRVECWRKTAEFVRDYAAKGRTVSIMGRMECDKFEVNGEKRQSWKLVAYDVRLVGPKPGGDRESNEFR